jgi:hypothetical protein
MPSALRRPTCRCTSSHSSSASCSSSSCRGPQTPAWSPTACSCHRVARHRRRNAGAEARGARATRASASSSAVSFASSWGALQPRPAAAGSARAAASRCSCCASCCAAGAAAQASLRRAAPRGGVGGWGGAWGGAASSGSRAGGRQALGEVVARAGWQQPALLPSLPSTLAPPLAPPPPALPHHTGAAAPPEPEARLCGEAEEGGGDGVQLRLGHAAGFEWARGRCCRLLLLRTCVVRRLQRLRWLTAAGARVLLLQRDGDGRRRLRSRLDQGGLLIAFRQGGQDAEVALRGRGRGDGDRQGGAPGGWGQEEGAQCGRRADEHQRERGGGPPPPGRMLRARRRG